VSRSGRTSSSIPLRYPWFSPAVSHRSPSSSPSTTVTTTTTTSSSLLLSSFRPGRLRLSRVTTCLSVLWAACVRESARRRVHPDTRQPDLVVPVVFSS
jgi:hypothetical protein